jgi:replication-associated recombination protein RarA
MQLRTKRGYVLSEVVSCLQKAIRRADPKLAGYMAIEMWASGYSAYCWRRLLTISAEDCFGVITQEIVALQTAFDQVNKVPNRKKKSEDKEPPRGRIFLAKAVILLCQAKKSRDADHLTNYVYDREMVDAERALAELDQGDLFKVELPEWTFDVHTARGKKKGKTKREFFREEFDALKPREPGFFDDVIE